MTATNFLFSIYFACFLHIDPIEIGKCVRVGGEFEWLGMSLEVIGEDNFTEDLR